MSLNLLPSEAKFQAEKIKQKALASQIMIWMTSVWIVIIIFILVANFTVGVLAKNSSSQLEKAMNNFLAMKDDVQTSQQLKYEAKLVGGSLNSRFEYGKSFELMQSLFPEGIILSNYDLQEKGLFELTGYTTGRSNISVLEKIITDINSGQKENLANCKMISLSVKNDVWTFAMEVNIK